MKSGKLKIITASLMLCLMFCVSILSGCSLVTTDYSQYYKAIVASTTTESGKKIEITKRDLIIAYRSYGYQYSSYYGKSVEEAIELTLEQLVSTQLIVEKVEKYSKEKNGGEVLTSQEKKYLWEKTYDSVISNLDSLLSTSDDEDDDESDDSAVEKQTYEKTADVFFNSKTNKYEIVKREKTKTTLESYTFWSNGNKDASTEAGREEIYNLVGDFVVSNSKYASAYSKYISQLKASEEGQKLSTVNKEVMLREIENLYETNYESYLVTRYEEIFKYDETNVTVEDILSLYRKEILDDYATYDIEQSSTFSEEVIDSADGMYYVPTDGKEFFYVTHILLKFDDDQTALLEEYNATLEGEGSGEYTVKQAKDGIEELYKGLYATVRVENEDGKYEVSDSLSKKDVDVNKVLREVQNATSSGTEYEKAENFYDLMVKYTEDDGTISSKYNYVIGVDYSTPTLDEDGEETKSYTAYTKMVDGFTDGAIELYNHGNAKIGDISGLVRSEYGIHILMYGGKVENLCDNIGLKMTIPNDVIAKLYETRINPCVDYTYFDMFYDKLVSDNFSTFKSNDILLMKSKMADYNFYKNAYKDLI